MLKQNKNNYKKNKRQFSLLSSVKLAFIPHKSNNYRPHLVRRYSLIAITFLIIGTQLGQNGILSGGVLGVKSLITVDQLLEKTNQTRSDYNLPTLSLNEDLNKAARLKAQDMLDNQYWAHVSPSGIQPWRWFDEVGYEYNSAGENLAKNFSTTEAAMLAWMNSAGHRDNILHDGYKEVGFAVLSGEIDGQPTSLVVALFGSPAGSSVAGVNSQFMQPQTALSNSLLARFAIATRSVTAVTSFGLILILLAIVVSGLSHAHRKNLPKHLQKSLYRFHGLTKMFGLSALGLMVIWLYSGGQIL